MDNSFEDQYLDVLQNIEFAIVQASQRHPEILDLDVENAVEALVRVYRAEVDNHPVAPPRLSELEQEIYDYVQAMCECRLGRTKFTKDNRPVDLPLAVLTVGEIIACLKRIQRSIRRWSKRGGRRGYLDFVRQFIA